MKLDQIYCTNQGCYCKIIELISGTQVRIEFIDKYKFKKIIDPRDLKRGRCTNPYHVSVFGIGFLGSGKHKVMLNKKPSIKYIKWRSMLERVYTTTTLNNKSYSKCKVVSDWKNYQNFSDWFEHNYVAGYELDKDLKKHNNKTYGPKYCMFLPPWLNRAFINCNNKDRTLPTGVSRNNTHKYVARISIDGIYQHHIATCTSVKSAEQKYLTYKFEYIKNKLEKENISNKEYILNLVKQKLIKSCQHSRLTGLN